MARNGKATNFMCNISPFDGDPEILNFFFNQVAEIAEINGWSDIQTFAFCKSKLAGNALKFFISSEAAQKAQNVADLKIIFSEFFRPKNRQSALLELQSIQLLPNETYLNLNQRIDSLIRLVHPELDTKAALDSVKTNYFLNCITPLHKVKILEADISNYDDIVARAQLLQDVAIQTNILNPIPSLSSNTISISKPVLDDLSAQVNYLKEDVKKLNNVNNAQLNQFHNINRIYKCCRRRDYLEGFQAQSTEPNTSIPPLQPVNRYFLRSNVAR